MVRIQNPEEYNHIGFQKSTQRHKKYDALLEHKTTKKIVRIPFGQVKSNGIPYEQYKDNTGLDLYSEYDHHDWLRRRNYLKRHYNTIDHKFSSSWFSKNYLW